MEMETFQDLLLPMPTFDDKLVVEETTMAIVVNFNVYHEVFITEDLEVEAEPL